MQKQSRTHLIVDEVTARIAARSRQRRLRYLRDVRKAKQATRPRTSAGCANLAHGAAACGAHEKGLLLSGAAPNVAIVSSYNDMLSAHQPFERFPVELKKSILLAGGVAQFAGGVPAMCDGITQGRPGMELSLFSRDVVALSTAIALSHDMFDAVLLLGVCDKIVPGLLMGALAFGHLPGLLVPAGPMPTGISNGEKGRVRQLHAQGQIDEAALLESEARSYHSPGTCTFYGTANTNQLLMEAMGLHLPGSSFVAPNTALRAALTRAAGRRAVELAHDDSAPSIGEIVNEKSLVNAMVALLATGGSTNHTMHLVAIAAAAGIRLEWSDFAELSAVVPLLARVYPNGPDDINAFHSAGGTARLLSELLAAGLVHEDVPTVAGQGLAQYCETPVLEDKALCWRRASHENVEGVDVLRSARSPFADDGGIRLLTGGLGHAVCKVSAVRSEQRVIEAPARVFDAQWDFIGAFERGEITEDAVIVVRFQGPRANGMPELHKLIPALGVLQDRGLRIALVTDGRMSGASGKVLAAIHCTPEAADGGPLARIQNGDVIRIDTMADTIDVIDVDLDEREVATPRTNEHSGMGRELFDVFRANVSRADLGASIFGERVAA